MRRQTLGVLSSSDLNVVRETAVASQLSGKAGRMSMGVQGAARRSSVGAGTSRKSLVGAGPVTAGGRSSSLLSTTSNKDPRNIGDKSYVGNSVRILSDFLVEHGFDQPISKNLMKPTTKDFLTIAVFLIRQFDSNFQPTGKVEDEIIAAFKWFGYQYTISKANIQAVGAPHAWPSLLASLMWMIELYDYKKGAALAEDDGAEMDLDDPASSERGFYRYLGKSYNAFINANDDLYATLEENFVGAFDNQNVLIKDQNEALSKKNSALNIEIEGVKRQSAYVPELQAKTREFQQSHQKFIALTEEMKKQLDLLKLKVDGRKAEMEKLNASLSAINKENALLRERINNQELSPEDVTNMLNEKQRLEDAQAAAADNRQNLQRRIWELESVLREKVHTLEETVRAYHSIAEDLKLIPQNARNARGENLTIEVDTRAKKREGVLKTDIRKAIIPVLTDLKKELNETTLGLRSELLAEQDIAEEVELKKSELRDGIEAYDAKLKRAEAVYKREKESLENGMSIHQTEVEALEARLQQMKEVAPEDTRIAAATRRINETNSIRAARKQEHQRKKASMIDSIMDVVSLCASHRENVQSQLEGVKEMYSSRLETFLTANPLNLDSYVAISKQIFQSSSGSVTLRDHIPSSSGKKHFRGANTSTAADAASKLNTPSVHDDSFVVGSMSHYSNTSKSVNGSGMMRRETIPFGIVDGNHEDLFSPIASNFDVEHNRHIILSEEKSVMNESLQSDVEAAVQNLSRIVSDPDPRRALNYNFEAVA